MDKKHVFIMGSRGYKKNYGGWETLVDNLIEQWKDDDYIFHVSEVIHEKKNHGQVKIVDDVLCHQIYVDKTGHATMVFFAIKALKNAIACVEREQIKNAVFYILGVRIGPIFSFYRKKLDRLGIKVVINPDGLEWKRSKWNWIIKKYFLFSEKTMIKSSDAVICDSKCINYYIDKKYGVHSYYASYGARYLENGYNDLKIIEKFKLKPKSYYLLVGRFVPENNYELIIREFMKSETKRELIIVTNFETNKFYKNLLKSTNFKMDSRIRIIGAVYNKQILQALRYFAFAYIHGHSAGGTNPSLLEAMALTDLVLAYDVNFNKEVIGDSEYYFSNRSGHLVTMINEIDRVSDDVIEDNGKKNKQRINNYYTWEKVTKSTKNVFEKLIETDYKNEDTTL